MLKKFVLSGAVGMSALIATPAAAAVIPDGTVTVAGLFAPDVNFGSMPATYTAMMGSTFQVVGTGGFAGATGLNGTFNGSLQFSNLVGTTLVQSVSDFFTFADGSGGTFNFSVDSVRTSGYTFIPGVTSSASLYLLGSTVNTARGFTSTPTSLTVSFNSTGDSPFSTSATLAVPPAPISSPVPEPGSWALMIVGFGIVGASARARKRQSVAVSYV